MKLMYLLATFAVVLVMMASCTRQSVTGYTLTAAIDGIPDGSHVQLFPVSHGHEKPVADTLHKAGLPNKKAIDLSMAFLFGSPWGNRTPLSRMKILRPNR
jgi:hypothetical protein